LERLGEGGMGEVYKAWQPSLKRWVALKMIRDARLADPGERQRFRAEAEAVAGLDHPQIVPVYEVGEHHGLPFFSLKVIEGGSRRKAIDRGAWAPKTRGGLRRIARLVARVARAVHHAHQRGVLHRDLKPANVLLDEHDEPYVADFGLAKRLGLPVPCRPGDGRPFAPGKDAALTATDALVGTPAYMAPEQARGEKALTTAADVWALAAILSELLTGKIPFQGANIRDMLVRIREEEPAPPRSPARAIDRDLEAVCLRCLHKDPARRYDSAADLADDLERWLRLEPIR